VKRLAWFVSSWRRLGSGVRIHPIGRLSCAGFLATTVLASQASADDHDRRDGLYARGALGPGGFLGKGRDGGAVETTPRGVSFDYQLALGLAVVPGLDLGVTVFGSVLPDAYRNIQRDGTASANALGLVLTARPDRDRPWFVEASGGFFLGGIHPNIRSPTGWAANLAGGWEWTWGHLAMGPMVRLSRYWYVGGVVFHGDDAGGTCGTCDFGGRAFVPALLFAITAR
jgi:hypothetical protein